MFYSQRQDELLSLLQKEGTMTVRELSRRLFISEATVRRDLCVLAEAGKVRRTFGGAAPVKEDWREVPLLFRQSQNVEAKVRMAQYAKRFIRDGQVIFLDSSSSAAHMVVHLEQFCDLTVITNSPQTSIALAERNICNYCTGGLLLNHSFSYVGGNAADFIEQVRADVVFFSCRGYMPEEGVLSESSAEEVYIKRKMIQNAKKRIFLCDKSKFHREFPHRIGNIRDVDEMVSEDTPL